MDNKEREEIRKIIDERIRKSLLQRGLISDKMDEVHAVIWRDMQTVKADVKKLRSDLDGHFERHLHALEKRKRNDAREKRK